MGTKWSVEGNSCQSILDNAIEGILIAEIDSKKFKYANKAVCKLFGFNLGEMLALGVSDIHPPDQLQDVLNTFEAQARGEIALAVETQCQRKNGTVFWADINTSKIIVDGIACNVGFFSDVTERRASRDELDTSQRLLSSVFNAVPDLLIVVDRDFRIQYTNFKGHDSIQQADFDKAKTCYGRFKLLNSPCDDCSALPVFESGAIIEREMVNPADGRTREVRAFPIKDADGKVLYVVEYVRDITDKIQAQDDRIQLEQQLQHNQRLESLGILAGGIAHDFNNLLGGIYGYIDMARAKSSDPVVNSYLDSSLTTMNRTRNLTQQLLTFAKGGSPNRKTGSLVKFIRETSEFALSGSNVSCEFNIPDDLLMCDFDANQMSQVVDNIVINAVQAMPMGGKLEITARNLQLDSKTQSAQHTGSYIRLSFKDSGIGIPSEILGRIFDPFFSTKQKGSGLGLATSYSIVKKHDGCIEVESKPGKGSTFHVYLPASNKVEIAPQTINKTRPRTSGIVIVMDDEEVMRDSIEQMLNYGDYTVRLANDGKEALRLFAACRQSKDDVAAILLDLTVPGGMGGKQTVEEIRKVDRGIPVFVTSGYADDPIVQNPHHYGFTDSISKPFLRTDLYELIAKYVKES